MRAATSVAMARAATFPPRPGPQQPGPQGPVELERQIEAIEIEIRDQIADGLNGNVVRRLFSFGLSVSSLASQMTDPEVRLSVWPAAGG